MMVFVLSLTGCGGDSGTSPGGADVYSQAEIYPIGVGYSWTYVDFDTTGAPRDTQTVVIQEDRVDGDTHHLTKCWLESGGLCPMDEIVTPSVVSRDVIGEQCDFLRFPLRVGQSWTTCHDLLLQVIPTGDLHLRTGLFIRDVRAIAISGIKIKIDDNGVEVGLDTVYVETDYYARGWGLVALESMNEFTGRVNNRVEVLSCSFRQR
jgi:hypothetical protein